MHSKALLTLGAGWTTAVLGSAAGQKQKTEVSAVQVSCVETFSILLHCV